MRPAGLLLLATALVWQVLVGSSFGIGPARPDFLLLAVAYVALYESPRGALGFAFMAGLLADLVSADPWGAHVLGYLLPAWALGLAGAARWGDDPLARAGLAALASALSGGVRDVVLLVLEPDARGPAWPLLADALLAAAVAPLAFALLDPYRERLAPERRGLIL